MVAFGVRLAEISGSIARRYFRSALAVIDKPDATPVTIADREAETAMRAEIARAYPQHGIVGEEHGSERPDAEFVWYLDPIDGTKSFIAGVPLFGTLIGLAREGRPYLGIIDHPALNERWIGLSGRSTTFNGAPARCRPCARLEDAQLFTTDPELFEGAEREAFGRVRQRVKRVRYGADCYAYGLVASGWADLVVETDLDATDFMALAPVIDGAGGALRDWQGRAITPASSGQVLAVGDLRLLAPAQALLTGAA
ncbi:MAG: histidinol-phosphatase [Alphaproteobacteria bacterium]|nr:histidinol-phosphatase [Alphaproteobacteria bacterium]